MTHNWDPVGCLFPGLPSELRILCSLAYPIFFAELLDGPLSCDRVLMDNIYGCYRAHRNLEFVGLFPDIGPLTKWWLERAPQLTFYLKIGLSSSGTEITERRRLSR